MTTAFRLFEWVMCSAKSLMGGMNRSLGLKSREPHKPAALGGVCRFLQESQISSV
jgi:hypothetical protein